MLFVCLLQTIFSRRMRGRVRGGGNPVGGASVGFSSHSHAKFVNQLMRESRFRVREGEGEVGRVREGEGEVGREIP